MGRRSGYPNYYLSILGFALDLLDQPQEAIEVLTCSVERDHDYLPGHLRLASLLARTGRLEDARKAAAEVMRINPRFQINSSPLGLYRTRDQSAMKRIVDGLVRAVLPLQD